MTRHAYLSPFEWSFFERSDIVTVLQIFYDASEGGGYLAVGGYVFRKKNIRSFEKRWNAMLRKYGLEFFHMTDCNRGYGPYKHLTESECDACARTAISIITDSVMFGITAAVDVKEFERSNLGGMMPSPFSLAAYSATMMGAQWAHDNDREARISYIFEAGDDYQSDANQLLNSIADDPERRNFYNYENHGFLPKRSSLPTQAADILAWNCRKQWARETQGISRLRGDFNALIDQVLTKKFLWDSNHLNNIKKIMGGKTGNNAWPDVVGLQMRETKSNSRLTHQKIRETLSLSD